MAETETPTAADPMEDVGAAIRELATGITSSIRDELRALRDELRPAAPVETPAPERNAALLPGGRVAAADDIMTHPIVAGWRDAMGGSPTPEEVRRNARANFEVAMLIQANARAMRAPVEMQYSDEFTTAARAFMFEDRTLPQLRIVDANGRSRAMDTAESGFGADLIGAQYVSEMWEAARNLDTLVGDIRAIPMAAPTVYIPINGELPEMLFVGESTTYNATAYTSVKTPSSRATMAAKKFTIQQRWSGELGEDSIVPFVPFLREMLAISAAQHLGSAYLNGDTTNAGTGNINSDDADPADTKHYLAWDGIRHDWIVTTTANGVNMAAALDIAKINTARGKLNGVDDDVDAAVKTINWGKNPRELRLVADWDTYMALLESDKVTTVDKYGAGATILTGELGSIFGIPIISPSYASKTEADGKASGTEASNTKGQISIFNPRAYLAGVRRETQMFMDRVQGTDQFLIELYTRRGFTRFGTNGAAGIYNITL